MKHLKPVIYQEIDGRRHTVEGSFAVAKNTFGFDVGDYDNSRPLIIDPLTLSYSTYLGGSGDDEGYGIAVDSDQHAYVTGETWSQNFPTTAGAFQQAFGGGYDDVFVTKLNPAGTALVYSTYLGGNGRDEGYGIAVDSDQHAYVTGYTESSNFPTTADAFQQAFGGDYDVFVTKLNPAGSALVYSTYLGGSSYDDGYGIAVDSDQHAYVTGITWCNFPTTTGAFQQAHGGGGSDAFVTKLNPAGTALVYSTYLGGNWGDGGRGIAVDSDQHAYVTGYTVSNFPTTADAFQQASGGSCDAFVTQFDFTGSALIYSTYMGGNGNDRGYGIDVDSNQHAYVTGSTWSNFPTTAGAFQQASGGSYDAFVTKFDASVIYVPDNYATIQAAVNAVNLYANEIIVRDGTYVENVDINKRLTIRSENGSDSTIVQAASSNDHVFEVTAEYVNISGFTMTGATGDEKAGIYLYGANHSVISNNNASNNYYGVRVSSLWYCDINNNIISYNSNAGISVK